jgi:hypothetical protein
LFVDILSEQTKIENSPEKKPEPVYAGIDWKTAALLGVVTTGMICWQFSEIFGRRKGFPITGTRKRLPHSVEEQLFESDFDEDFQMIPEEKAIANEHISTLSPLELALLDEVEELPNHPRQIRCGTAKPSNFKKQKQKIPYERKAKSSPPKKERSMFSRIATSVILIALMWFGVLSWQNVQREKTRDVQPTQNLAETSAQKSITIPQQPKIRTKGIEEFVIGERVLGKNPLVTEEERALFGPEPTPETYQGYVLLLPHEENDSVTLAQLLRPKDWLNDDFARIVELESEPDETGQTTTEECIFVWLELPEMGAVGWAELLGVVELDQFTSGKGNLVTGTFCHLAPETIDLIVEDVDPIGCTPNHPFWSVDRQDYISAGELVPNERVLLYNGETKRVINKLSRPGPEFVYNLEVFGEHVYHVTTDGVLVHNNCLNFFEKNNIPVSNHAHGRILYRNNTRGITDRGIIRSYTRGTLYYNPNSGRYIRYDNKTGITVVVSKPTHGSIITVFEQNNPSSLWQKVKWRPGL